MALAAVGGFVDTAEAASITPIHVESIDRLDSVNYVAAGKFRQIRYDDIPDIHEITCFARNAHNCTVDDACFLDMRNLCQPANPLTNDQVLSNVFRFDSATNTTPANPNRLNMIHMNAHASALVKDSRGAYEGRAVFKRMMLPMEFPSIQEAKCNMMTTRTSCHVLNEMCVYDARRHVCTANPSRRINNKTLVEHMSTDPHTALTGDSQDSPQHAGRRLMLDTEGRFVQAGMVGERRDSFDDAIDHLFENQMPEFDDDLVEVLSSFVSRDPSNLEAAASTAGGAGAAEVMDLGTFDF